MTSYELSSMILELRYQLEDGLIDEETFNDTVEGLCVEDKLNGLIYANKRLDAEVEMLKQEKKRIDDEIKRQAKNQERVKGLINLLMESTKSKKFEGVAGKVSYRKSKSLEVSDEFAELHKDEEYVTKETKYKVDKKLLKSLIDEYGEIDGVIIIEKKNIQIK